MARRKNLVPVKVKTRGNSAACIAAIHPFASTSKGNNGTLMEGQDKLAGCALKRSERYEGFLLYIWSIDFHGHPYHLNPLLDIGYLNQAGQALVDDAFYEDISDAAARTEMERNR